MAKQSLVWLLLALAAGASSSALLSAQLLRLEPSWTAVWGGGGADAAFNVDVDESSVYVAGVSRSYGSGDAFLLKYGRDGGFQWGVTWGGGSYEAATGVAVVGSYIYTAGYSLAAGSADIFLLKYSKSGQLLWTAEWRGKEDDYAYSLAVGGRELYVAGESLSVSPDKRSEAILLAFDLDGGLLWAASWGGDDTDAALAVCVGGGHVYVAGQSYGYEYGGLDAFLLKYDSSGQLAWSRAWGGGANDAAQAVAEGGGYIYVAGYTESFTRGRSDAFLLKYDASGNLVWSKTWGGEGRDEAYGVAACSGEIYVVGFTESYGNGEDIFLLKYDASGNLVWSKTWGGEGRERGYGIACSNPAIYITGYTDSSRPSIDALTLAAGDETASGAAGRIAGVDAPLSITAGSEATIRVDVENTGSESCKYSVVMTVEGELAESESIALKPGEAASLNLKLEADKPGVLHVTVYLYAGKQVVDRRSFSVEVKEGEARVTVDVTAESEAYVGDQLEVSVVLESSSPFELELKLVAELSDGLSSEAPLEASITLPPGATESVTWSITAVEKGLQSIKVVAERNGLVLDSKLVQLVVEGPAADIKLRAPSQVAAGEEFAIDVLVENKGIRREKLMVGVTADGCEVKPAIKYVQLDAGKTTTLKFTGKAEASGKAVIEAHVAAPSAREVLDSDRIYVKVEKKVEEATAEKKVEEATASNTTASLAATNQTTVSRQAATGEASPTGGIFSKVRPLLFSTPGVLVIASGGVAVAVALAASRRRRPERTATQEPALQPQRVETEVYDEEVD